MSIAINKPRIHMLAYSILNRMEPGAFLKCADIMMMMMGVNPQLQWEVLLLCLCVECVSFFVGGRKSF